MPFFGYFAYGLYDIVPGLPRHFTNVPRDTHARDEASCANALVWSLHDAHDHMLIFWCIFDDDTWKCFEARAPSNSVLTRDGDIVVRSEKFVMNASYMEKKSIRRRA